MTDPTNVDGSATVSRRRSSARLIRQRGASTFSSGPPILAFRKPWIRHYIDIGHCRLPKCTVRIQQATEKDIEVLSISFLAMAITAVGGSGYKSKDKQERDLIDYTEALINRRVDPNDEHKGRSALGLAAYYGYTGLLKILLEAGSSISANPGAEHALFLAVANFQHASIRMLFDYRTEQIRSILEKESMSLIRKWNTARKAIYHKDIEAIEILRERGGLKLHDRDVHNDILRKNLVSILQQLYPGANVRCWSRTLHWSFSRNDRGTINWLWHVLVVNQCGQQHQHQLPPEIWLRIFSFIGRNWFSNEQNRRLIDAIGYS